MELDLIKDQAKKPSMQEIQTYFFKDAGARWVNLVMFIENTFDVKPSVVFSRETPGWNVKYKKSAKALCTLYPQKDGFLTLIVLNAQDMQHFDTIKQSYTPYLVELYDRCRLFNGTKWLMIHVTDDLILEDVIKLIKLKWLSAGKSKHIKV